jgi:hypothetical protein
MSIDGVVRLDATTVFCLAVDVGNTPAESNTWRLSAWLMIGGTRLDVNPHIVKVHELPGPHAYDFVIYDVTGTFDIDDNKLTAFENRFEILAGLPAWVGGYLADSYRKASNPLPHLRTVVPGAWSFRKRGDLASVSLNDVVVWEGKVHSLFDETETKDDQVCPAER